MSQEAPQEPIAKKVVLYQLPGMDAVSIRHDVPYQATDSGALTLDLYAPPDSASGARLPAVVIVAGYPDPGFQKMMGCRFKEMGSSTSWGRLIAASGMVAITYANREPAADVGALLQYVRQNAEELGIDETRIGLWASSGNVPLALSVLMQEDRESLRGAVLCYGITLDLDGSTRVAAAAETWKFVNPAQGKAVEDLPPETPLFIARAGQDQIPHLNETLDRFLARALALNLPITFVNHPTAPHAFDLFLDSEDTREVIRRILAFLRFHLQA